MIKITYTLISVGLRNGIRVANQLINTKPHKAPYYHKPRYEIGLDEETCLNKIRNKLKGNIQGYRILKTEYIERKAT